MFGSRFWEEIFGEQILLNEKKIYGGGGGGGKMGNNFFLKQNFWRGNFWGPSFGGEILVRCKNILEDFCK